MSEFGDMFFGMVAIIVCIVWALFFLEPPVHVYTPYEIDQMRETNRMLACLIRNIPDEREMTDGEFDQIEAKCSAGKNR